MTTQTGFQLGIIAALVLAVIGFLTGVLPEPDPIWAVIGRWFSD